MSSRGPVLLHRLAAPTLRPRAPWCQKVNARSFGTSASCCHFADYFLVMSKSARVLRLSTWFRDGTKSERFP